MNLYQTVKTLLDLVRSWQEPLLDLSYKVGAKITRSSCSLGVGKFNREPNRRNRELEPKNSVPEISRFFNFGSRLTKENQNCWLLLVFKIVVPIVGDCCLFSFEFERTITYMCCTVALCCIDVWIVPGDCVKNYGKCYLNLLFNGLSKLFLITYSNCD